MPRIFPLAGLALFVILGVSACSGDGASATPTQGPTPTRAAAADSDREYAKAVCSAFNRYLTSFGAASQRDPQLFADQAKMLRVAAPILETFYKDLKKAKPPKDVANFHGALVEKVDIIAKKAKSGQLISTQELANVTKGAPLPPGTVRSRLVEAAASIPECGTSGGMDALFGAPTEP